MSKLRVVYNKLLGGWFVVRGPHQTPLTGRFDTKTAADNWLNRKIRHNPVVWAQNNRENDMIVYNVKRKWFSEKVMAYRYRVAEGLPPFALLKVTVSDRNDLATLLNMLCEPSAVAPPTPPFVPLVDRAYVTTEKDDFLDYVPRFLLDPDSQKEWDKRHLK